VELNFIMTNSFFKEAFVFMPPSGLSRLVHIVTSYYYLDRLRDVDV
jgi:hypothetical protein